jgi:hypothetical protein
MRSHARRHARRRTRQQTPRLGPGAADPGGTTPPTGLGCCWVWGSAGRWSTASSWATSPPATRCVCVGAKRACVCAGGGGGGRRWRGDECASVAECCHPLRARCALLCAGTPGRVCGVLCCWAAPATPSTQHRPVSTSGRGSWVACAALRGKGEGMCMWLPPGVPHPAHLQRSCTPPLRRAACGGVPTRACLVVCARMHSPAVLQAGTHCLLTANASAPLPPCSTRHHHNHPPTHAHSHPRPHARPTHTHTRHPLQAEAHLDSAKRHAAIAASETAKAAKAGAADAKGRASSAASDAKGRASSLAADARGKAGAAADDAKSAAQVRPSRGCSCCVCGCVWGGCC